jgi:cytochrome oxidase assembly protein ShyY1
MSSGGGLPLERDGRVTWRRLDLDAIRGRLPYPILDVVLVQAPDSSLPRFPRRVEPPPLDDGPHRNYAIQWFAFALTALVIGGAILRRVPAGRRDLPG